MVVQVDELRHVHVCVNFSTISPLLIFCFSLISVMSTRTELFNN